MRSIYYSCAFMVILVTIILGLAGCLNNVCQNPPPQFYFQIVDAGTIYPSRPDTNAVIDIWYTQGNEKKMVTDVNKVEDVFQSAMLIIHAQESNDQEFTFELNRRVIAKIRLETYIDKGKCDGWAHVSKVYQNGKMISKSLTGVYRIGE